MFHKENKLNFGFSAVEVLVSISIVTVIMSSVLFNYSTFNDNLSLSSAGQEMAIILRQAQTYGLTVKEVGVNTGRFDSAYGVYFDKNDSGYYYLFADLDKDGKYDVGSGCGSGVNNTECVEKFTLRNRVTISNVCNGSSCPPESSVRAMHVTFLRPNPDAIINFTNSGGQVVNSVSPSNTGKIVLTSSKNETITVSIETTGQVLVEQIN